MFENEIQAWDLAARVADVARRSPRDGGEVVSALDALVAFAQARAKELRAIAHQDSLSAQFYSQNASPFGTGPTASRRYRMFVLEHALPCRREGRLVLVEREVFDAKLRELAEGTARSPGAPR
jgi:hypothetical protein